MDVQFLQKLIDEITSRQADIYNIVYFYGNQHHINTMIDVIAKKCHNRQITRVTGSAFRDEMMQIILNGGQSTLDCDLYIFERIEKVAGLEANEQRLYGVLDWLLEQKKQIIITGTIPVKEIERLAPRIRAQIDGGISLYIT